MRDVISQTILPRGIGIYGKTLYDKKYYEKNKKPSNIT